MITDSESSEFNIDEKKSINWDDMVSALHRSDTTAAIYSLFLKTLFDVTLII